MKTLLQAGVLLLLTLPVQAVDCFNLVEEGATMEVVRNLCGPPNYQKELGSDMRVKEQEAGTARITTIEHSFTETLWVYEQDSETYLRFRNGRLVEKELSTTEQ